MAPTSRKRPRRNPPAPATSRARATAPAAKPPRPADSSTRAARVLDALLGKLPERYRQKAHDILVLTRMDRPIGTLLLLWPTWWALWLAARDFPPWKPLVIFTLGVFAMRAAGCAINDYADRNLDPQVARTAGRPIAAGRITPREALIVFGVLLLVAFLLVLLTNPLTIKLSFVGAALAALYPFTKRYTDLPQVVLGAAFGWSIPMAFAAVQNQVPAVGWVLFIANILWSVIYDTEYAMVDRDDDLKAGARSTAILFGDADLMIIGVLMGTFLTAMVMVGTRAHLGWPYWLAMVVTAGLFGWQQWLIRHRERNACLAAFRHNNWLGLTLWIGIALALAVR
ncbi:4-hydroxybenzoate octaprenyltransferase [Dyella mobilis]|uniref:4-hydroxybenzoate octaprenyltransferase n=1 Tax=Dyella mobilis TaxID=1849582 RepID=A0ABS2KEI3_9GAMM|nr:4-hydroxybenzoate octaprenyltransferase [Dyella mobilis]MBM7129349.1 4-hydroxybenzoate octaprenyltransferase [Dyella mobilis]GLQ98643.1 4-hydroxybenzoate octaprenyltransferase [Dyella mobilis]